MAIDVPRKVGTGTANLLVFGIKLKQVNKS